MTSSPPPALCELQPRKVEIQDAAFSKDLTSHHAAFHSCFLMLLAALCPKEKEAAHKMTPQGGCNFDTYFPTCYANFCVQLDCIGARGLSLPYCPPRILVAPNGRREKRCGGDRCLLLKIFFEKTQIIGCKKQASTTSHSAILSTDPWAFERFPWCMPRCNSLQCFARVLYPHAARSVPKRLK